ncbi:hypothetical protein O181_026149 [Austropuccinia psidii MF-1]|uniref:DUF4939 domain-containing protein n=1 Tax=Austropuccinia psidii MF-1 TaxID=1389203 RepID=A0A9Q3CJE7_9BASI|nr:hypothetical protein [Austropuccinia psidii MF-1]
MIEQMAEFIGNLAQGADPRDKSATTRFKTPSMKAPDSFDGSQVHKLGVSIQSCELLFHNDPENFFPNMKKGLYSTSCLTGRAGKWIEPYIANFSSEDPSYLLNN